ncbi:hypothetical protein B0O99DRAFT_728591 [Bisporella sp. PMI_857]|nr:hypothetical protein B0O99DRAFT_728591 [Bisporella sp. PMI_857]
MYFSTLFIVAAALGFIAPTALALLVLPNPDDVYISKVAYSGTGCPAGSITNTTDPTKQAFTLYFDNYVVSVGPGTKIASRRTGCAVNLDIRYPQGYQYSIISVDYRGYADLDKGVTGEEQSIYYFSGQQQQFRARSAWKGEYLNDYLITDKYASESVVWSPCEANHPLNINTELRITPLRAQEFSFFTKVTQEYHLSWRKCAK